MLCGEKRLITHLGFTGNVASERTKPNVTEVLMDIE